MSGQSTSGSASADIPDDFSPDCFHRHSGSRDHEEFFDEQFQVNTTDASMKYWQVYDRTVNEEVPREKWSYNKATQVVTISGVEPFHTYTVSFLAYRIWEEISMYNHTTNNWDKEHLMQVDPRYPETRKYLTDWMENWCKTHPDTTVVRFTSLFYNFVWIWGSDERNRNLFTDWVPMTLR